MNIHDLESERAPTGRPHADPESATADERVHDTTGPLTPAQVLRLQQTAGNAAVGRALARQRTLNQQGMISMQGLEDALHLCVPSISCAGSRVASRLGGGMLHAAGLAHCVLDSPEAYQVEAVRLGRNPQALQELRQHLRAAKAGAPLFDLAARVREWEAAWATMAERTRAGLAPAACDVPSFASRTNP
jgi:hypothetical protein